eukprot:1130887-Amphidinium_carterae.1
MSLTSVIEASFTPSLATEHREGIMGTWRTWYEYHDAHFMKECTRENPSSSDASSALVVIAAASRTVAFVALLELCETPAFAQDFNDCVTHRGSTQQTSNKPKVAAKHQLMLAGSKPSTWLVYKSGNDTTSISLRNTFLLVPSSVRGQSATTTEEMFKPRQSCEPLSPLRALFHSWIGCLVPTLGLLGHT